MRVICLPLVLWFAACAFEPLCAADTVRPLGGTPAGSRRYAVGKLLTSDATSLGCELEDSGGEALIPSVFAAHHRCFARYWPSADFTDADDVTGAADFTGADDYGFGMGEELPCPYRWGRFTPAALIGFIQRSIAPGTWDDAGHAIEIEDHTLRVRHDPGTLARVEALLDGLLAERLRRYRVDVAILPASAVPDRGAYTTAGEDFMRLCRRAGPACMRVSLVAHDDQVVSVPMPDRWALQCDYHVSDVGVVPSVRAHARTSSLGTKIRVRPQAIAWTDHVCVSLHVRRRTARMPLQAVAFPLGPVDASWIERCDLETEVVAPRGRTVLAGFIEGTCEGVEPFAVLLKVETAGMPGTHAHTPVGDGAYPLRLYDMRFLRSRAGFAQTSHGELPWHPWQMCSLMMTLLAREDWDRSDVAWYANSCAAVLQHTPRAHDAVSDLFAQWTRELNVLCTIRLWLVSGDAVGAARLLSTQAPGGTLPGDWETMTRASGLEVVLAGGITGPFHRAISLASAAGRRYITRRVDCIGNDSLGCHVKACMAFDVEHAGSGAVVEVRVRPLSPSRAVLDLCFETAVTDLDAEAVFVLSCAAAPLDGAQKDPVFAQPPDLVARVPVTVQLPRSRAWQWERRLVLPYGAAVVAETREEGARVHALVVQVDRIQASSP